MELKITKQTNENECGVCTLTSLHNYYYGDDLDKTEVLERCCISDNGLTIFDLENCAKNVGLELESYEVSFVEFSNLKVKNFFILLVSSTNGNHYVIAKKDKKKIILYDSTFSKPKEISYKDLEKIYMNVLILVNKKPNPLFKKIFTNIKSLLMFDLKFVLINIVLSALILFLSIVGATYLNYVIDMAIGQGSLTNLITISIVYLFSFVSNEIIMYVSSLYCSKQLKSYMQLFTNNILSKLQYKDINFLEKVDKNWIFKIDECVYSISSFTVIEINKFITNSIFCVAYILILGCMQYWLLIFALAIVIVELVFFLFLYRKRNLIMLNIVKTENKNLWAYKQLIDSISYEIWPRKRKQIISQIKNNYSDIYKNYSDAIIFKENTSLAKGVLKNVLEITSIICMSYFVIKNFNFSIGKLIFCLSTLSLFKNSSSDFFHYFLAKIEFQIYWNVYKDLTLVNNYEIKNIERSNDVKTLTFNCSNKEIKLIKNKNNVVQDEFIKIIKNTKSIKLNDTKTEVNIGEIILVDEYSSLNNELLINDIQSDPGLFANYIKHYQINIDSNRQNAYIRMVINLLCLLKENNKLIILDNIYKYMPSKDKIIFNKLIMSIQKQNHVFFVRKEGYD